MYREKPFEELNQELQKEIELLKNKSFSLEEIKKIILKAKFSERELDNLENFTLDLWDRAFEDEYGFEDEEEDDYEW